MLLVQGLCNLLGAQCIKKSFVLVPLRIARLNRRLQTGMRQRLVELDPKTGKRMEGNEPVNIAIDCEATDLIYRNGWYYLLGTHGTCCDGPEFYQQYRGGTFAKDNRSIRR